jgi:hypothetical protein
LVRGLLDGAGQALAQGLGAAADALGDLCPLAPRGAQVRQPAILLLQHPNARVRAVARHLREGLGWTTRDSFTGEYVSHLYNYVEPQPDGTYDLSRIRPGAGEPWDDFLVAEHYRQGRGPAPHRILYVESRRAFRRRVGEQGMQVDGTYLVGYERVPEHGRLCFASRERDRRGRWHVTPATCHTW